MPLGTLDRTPPPFFRQGPSALTKLVFFAALAIFLMAADGRFALIEPLRAGLATALLPVQRTLAVPITLLQGGNQHLQGLRSALAQEREARAALTRQTERALRADLLAQENTRLRALLELRPAMQVKSVPAEVMFEAADPYSRKFFIDRGATQGVPLGAAVINEAGVLGQVTRLYPLTAEITLLADKDAAIPVLNTRSQQRSAAFGGGVGGLMELRFMPGNADVEQGDVLHTSGLDGIYPPGLPVARVHSVERRTDSTFARVLLTPLASPDGVRHVLVLEPPAAQWAQRPDGASSAPGALAAPAPARARATAAAGAGSGPTPVSVAPRPERAP